MSNFSLWETVQDGVAQGGTPMISRECSCCASATNDSRSRPRTLAVTTMRRLPCSRLIWFGSGAKSICASSERGT